MRGMANRDEVDSPATDDLTPLPGESGKGHPGSPTPATVLGWVAAARGQPWFPSQHAADTHTDRDALDVPLNLLRVAELIRVETWVRGTGQGYVLTPEGETALATGAGIPGKSFEPVGPGPSAIPDDPPLRFTFSLPLDPRPPLVVPVLFVANLLWFFVGLVIVLRAGQPVWPYLSEGNKEVLHRIGAVSGPALLDGEWWRLASSCFVHIGGAHLLFNLFALVMVGPLAELLWGRWRLVIIYMLSGLAGSCLAMALKPDSLLAGASGAIWGLLLSLVAWFILFRQYLPRDVVADSTRRLTIVIVLNAMFSFLPGISWQGHLGGAVAGFVSAWLLNAMRFGDQLRRILAFLLLLALPVASVGGVILAMKRGDAWAGYRQRSAEEEHRQAALAAAVAFDRDVAPLIEQLPPELVKPFEDKAVIQLIRSGERRNAARVAEIRAKLTELKGAADTAVARLAVPSSGVEAIDRYRERAKAFAEARAKSFALLLAMLDSPAIPDDKTWAAWTAARRNANALWVQFRHR